VKLLQYILMLTFLFTIFCGYGQDKDTYSISSPKAIKLYEKASELMKERQFDKALVILEKAVKTEPGFVEAHLGLAGCYKILGDGKSVKKHYLIAAQLNPDSKKLGSVYFKLGKFYIQEDEYEKALHYFNKVIKYPPRKKSKKSMLIDAEDIVKRCEFAIEAIKNPVTFDPVLMSDNVNRFPMQYFPVLTADRQTLIYTARKGFDLNDDEDIYITFSYNNKWSTPHSISKKINTLGNEGTCSISADGKILVFTCCDRKDSYGRCDLYISYKEGTQWSEPVNLGEKVNSIAWDSNPSLSADGRSLFFSSDRKDGIGGLDIWVSKLDDDGNWKPAINLGTPVNTNRNDLAPFIHPSGSTLYFSSDGHLGIGGFDLFYSVFNENLWTEPVNLGYPINSHNDENFLFVTADSKKGYYSVELKETKYSYPDFDRTGRILLYEFDVPDEFKSKYISTYAKGAIYDAVTKKKLVYQKLPASIELYDLKTGKLLYFTSADKITGEFLVVLTEGAQYAMYVNKDSYLFKSLFFR